MGYDVVVVGGGSAGCVLATRLSEDAGRTVMLVEAGPDHPDLRTMPRDIIDASEPTVDHDWGYTADAELDRGIPLPRARIMGGCSSTNACFALRGAPQDYDGWAALGNPGWSFADVLDDFRRLESDEDIRDQWHGSDGLIPIRRHPRSEMNRAQAAFLDGAVASGHRYVEDHNRPGSVGAGPTPRNVRDGMRMSTAVTYLALARSRGNLTIRPDTMVARVECSGTRATGIRLVDGTLIEGDRVVLTAGTYASPMILARSGIAPAAELQRLDIAPVVDLPGVGSNLVDHPLISIDPSDWTVSRSKSLSIPRYVPFWGSGPRRTRRPAAVHCGPVRGRTGPKCEWRRIRDCGRTHGTPITRLGTFGFQQAERPTSNSSCPSHRCRRSRTHARRRDRGTATRAQRTPGCDYHRDGTLVRTGSPDRQPRGTRDMGPYRRLDLPSPCRHMRYGPRPRSGCGHRLAWLGTWDRRSHDRRCVDHADHPDRDHKPPDDHGGRAHRAVAPKHLIPRSRPGPSNLGPTWLPKSRTVALETWRSSYKPW
jgi:choline dehydrogenase-like flavoprotein